MQKKSLPFFREIPPNQVDPLSPQSSSQVYGSGPNLVAQEEILPTNFFYVDKAFKFFRKASFFIAILFGLMLIVNLLINLKLESQRKMINQLANEAGQYTLVQKQALDINRKTKFYENTLTQRYLLGDKANVIFLNLGVATVLRTLTLTPEKFSMTIEVPTPLDFAILINKYLESDRIASVTLHSAELIANKNVFRVSLEGVYK